MELAHYFLRQSYQCVRAFVFFFSYYINGMTSCEQPENQKTSSEKVLILLQMKYLHFDMTKILTIAR